MKRHEEVLDLLAAGLVFDGELVVLDDNGRPLFNVVGVVVGCPSALTPPSKKTFDTGPHSGAALVRCKNNLRFYRRIVYKS
jgi:hypothetical protein